MDRENNWNFSLVVNYGNTIEESSRYVHLNERSLISHNIARHNASSRFRELDGARSLRESSITPTDFHEMCQSFVTLHTDVF